MHDPHHPCERTGCAAVPVADCSGQGSCQTRVTLSAARTEFERGALWSECDTGRYRCRYFSWGSGPALLFVPGLAEAAESFILVCCRLASQFRCIAYDLPGTPGDRSNPRQYTHDGLVADLFALLDHVGAPQSYVLGASFGATIALRAMHAQPQRIPRGILVGGFAHRPLAPAERCLTSLARFFPGTMRLLPWRRALLRRAHGAAFTGRDPEVWEYFLRRSGMPLIRTVARRARLLNDVDLRPILPEIRQPVLMICGDGDPLVHKDRQNELLRGLRNVARVELEECGHFPQYTHPELFADVVRGFLTPAPCASR